MSKLRTELCEHMLCMDSSRILFRASEMKTDKWPLGKLSERRYTKQNNKRLDTVFRRMEKVVS